MVFLKVHDGVYITCRFRGATLKLSPLGNETLPEGDTTQAKIKVLLKRSIDYWDNDWKQQREKLEKIIEGQSPLLTTNRAGVPPKEPAR